MDAGFVDRFVYLTWVGRSVVDSLVPPIASLGRAPARGGFWARDELETLHELAEATPYPLLEWEGRRWWLYRNLVLIENDFFEAQDAALFLDAHLTRRTRAKSRLEDAISGRGAVSRSSIPEDVRHAVWRRDGGRCAVCHLKTDLEFDHIIPLAMGGSSTERNLQLLCADCNRAKGANLG
jgi:5-methylcytosine-specific restriction endonuclease McrA